MYMLDISTYSIFSLILPTSGELIIQLRRASAIPMAIHVILAMPSVPCAWKRNHGRSGQGMWRCPENVMLVNVW